MHEMSKPIFLEKIRVLINCCQLKLPRVWKRLKKGPLFYDNAFKEIS